MEKTKVRVTAIKIVKYTLSESFEVDIDGFGEIDYRQVENELLRTHNNLEDPAWKKEEISTEFKF